MNLSPSSIKYVGFASVVSALSVPAWKARLSGATSLIVGHSLSASALNRLSILLLTVPTPMRMTPSPRRLKFPDGSQAPIPS